jgi:hypothetical protein
VRGCPVCGRIYAPQLAPAACGECGQKLRLFPLGDALKLARDRQDRLRGERVRRLAAMDPGDPLGRVT